MYSLGCPYNNCTRTGTFISQRGSDVCFNASGNSSCRAWGGETLRTTPSEMSFTAALPLKSNVSLKRRALKKTLQAWNKAAANSHLHYTTVDKVACLVPVSARHFSHLEWREPRRAELTGGSTFSHMALRRQTITSPALSKDNKLGA